MRSSASAATARASPAADLLDVADAAGVTPLADVSGDQMLDELKRWLHEQG